MQLVLISDTHNRHTDVFLPPGDVLIHAGDMSGRGTEAEIVDFMDWFSAQPHAHKILIAGNHDFYFENASKEELRQLLPSNIIYLNDSGCSIEGIQFWGSPVQPEFNNWAFNRESGPAIKKHWDLIPTNTDVLITHGPPFGILDATIQGKHVGCPDLLQAVYAVKPKIHVFGHIHESFGQHTTNGTHFINASVLNHQYYYTFEPVLVEV